MSLSVLCYDKAMNRGRVDAVSLSYNKKNVVLARTLRKNATAQERHLWYDFLADYPVRFQRQKAIDEYIADFYCHRAKLVIEVDGSQHSTEGVRMNTARKFWRGMI